MRAALLALAVATLGSATAGAQAVVSTAGRETVQVRARPDAVGDVYRYRSETRFVQKDDQGNQTQTNTLVFDLEVLGAEADGLRMRHTLREGRLEDSGGASMSAAVNAAVGGSLDFRVGRDGRVIAVETWPAYRTRLLSRVDAVLPAGDPVRALIHERMAGEPLHAAEEMVLGDVAILSMMEPRGGLPLGLTDLHDDRDGTPAKATLEVSVVRPGCIVGIERQTSRTLSGVSRAAVTKAQVSAHDGRVLTLEERRVTRARAGSQEETITIRRISAPPACG